MDGAWKTYFPTMAILHNILTSLSQETHEITMATFIQQNLGSAVSTNGCSQIYQINPINFNTNSYIPAQNLVVVSCTLKKNPFHFTNKKEPVPKKWECKF
jgi:hypothetical protein